MLQPAHTDTFNAVLNEPLAHALQLRSAVALPEAIIISPATQSRHVLHTEAFASVLKVPLAQPVHARSFVAEPALLTNCPAAHTLHGAQVVALMPALNEPLAQFEHTRSVVALPSFCTNCPAKHVVFGTHAVAGSPSLSQVPAGHAIACAMSPGHQVPASHGAQVTLEPEFPDEVTSVPGAHDPCDTHAERFSAEVKKPVGHVAQVRSAVADGAFAT